ncbi:hypothetical protein ASZ90_012763 [hydrocarbon metagenome]|uniref:Helicase n=1 Tax=hydrocarbon metagenome TaxID=938273 RepID=A0A0W8F9J3_9ZZZZ|nr:helicase-related protein [Methanothrix sp.]MBP7066719.1 DEAD/DEAH box helicase family protein [Methanothrix sp.]
MNCTFEDLKLQLAINYTGDGKKIGRDFYIPVLKRSKRYDRLSGYFSLDSLVVTAVGVAGLIANGGSMRLVVGAHDVGEELMTAQDLSIQRAAEIIEEIGCRISEDMSTLADVIAAERIKALAWMICTDRLEVRVAIPRKTYYHRGNGIFHEKLLIFEDDDGCHISAIGSANETRYAYEQNGESLTVHMSWREGASAYLEQHAKNFDSIWNNHHPDYLVFPLPDAIHRALRERYYSTEPPMNDPIENASQEKESAISQLVPAARLMRSIRCLAEFIHLGLGPVRLYPHQRFTMDAVFSRYPYRALLADEVGLGKTLEAGAIIKRLLDDRQAERVLILVPKNVAPQWLEELYFHFGIKFWLYKSSPKRMLVDAEHNKINLSQDESPYDYPGVNCLIVSWHYARRGEQRARILANERGFDLVVADEAHAARKNRSSGSVTRTLLNALLQEISIANPHLVLLTATPVQLNPLEAMDLLEILGLGGIWVHEQNFERFYDILQREPTEVPEDDWAFGLRMVQDFAIRMLGQHEIEEVTYSIAPIELRSDVLKMMGTRKEFGLVASRFLARDPIALRRFVMSFSPLQWLMIRNTRARLTEQGFTFPERNTQEVAVELLPSHIELLDSLDEYLRSQYAAYERLLNPQNRGTMGFVKCIYHQRFVSSFTAAYETLRHRLEFLDGILNRDRDAVRRVAEKILEDDEELDEEDYVEEMEELLSRSDVGIMIDRERVALTQLLDALTQYAPGCKGMSDPKMTKVYEVLSELLGEGRKVLVFSKYVDTIRALHGYLREHGMSSAEIALYTGEGGEIYDPLSGNYYIVAKEDVRKALEGPIIRVLLCTDAASEGLNLQAASAVINVDMPWNPARVEQRIGRVDRLGQRASSVCVRNVWYPGTIEARMYQVLFERHGVYQFVVGPAQEIFSRGLRQAFDLNARGEALNRFVAETFKEIDRIREENASAEGLFSGQQWAGEKTDDDVLVERLRGFVVSAAEALGLSTHELNDKLFVDGVPSYLDSWNGAALTSEKANALTPAHPILLWLAEEICRQSDSWPSLPISYYIIKDGMGVGHLYEIGDDGLMNELHGKDLLNAMDFLLAQGVRA